MLDQLNTFVLEYIEKYQNLKIYDQKVSTPYYINNLEPKVIKDLLKKAEISEDIIKKIHKMYKDREVPFGWYRGKGTPEQLEDAVMQISSQTHLNLVNATPYGIAEFMKLYGLGVDCSGFIYNTLYYALEKVNK